MPKIFSKNMTYVFLAIDTLLLPLVYYCGVRFMENSADANGHGIDGIGAALAAAFVFQIMMIIGFIIYFIIAVKVVKSIQYYKEIPNVLSVVPFIPIVLSIIISIATNYYNAIELKKAQETYTIDDYVAEVEAKKSQYSHKMNGERCIEAFDYIIYDVAEDNYWLHTRLQFDKTKRKALVDEAIPILMEDLEKEKLCRSKKDVYYEEEIEYWEYKQDQNILTVKFKTFDEPYDFEIKYIFD